MENTDDRTIWRYAKVNDFMIVTKDADFFEMASVYGQPPQIVWLKIGNQFKAATINALIANRQNIEQALVLLVPNLEVGNQQKETTLKIIAMNPLEFVLTEDLQ